MCRNRNASFLAPSRPRQWRVASSSMVKVPTMLVWMNGSAELIERSTWLSAARCITASGLCSSNTARTAARSATSAFTNA